MRELKDLNEVGPKLVQQLYELEESLSSKLSALDANELTLSNSTGETTSKLRVQRLFVCSELKISVLFTKLRIIKYYFHDHS